MIRSEVVHCLNVLGIVANEQFSEFAFTGRKNSENLLHAVLIMPLFIRYKALCMSLRDVVADYSWSGRQDALCADSESPFIGLVADSLTRVHFLGI